MAYLISEEAKDLLQDVHEFCENEVKEQCKAYDVSGEWPKEIYDKAIEMQLHSLEVPEEYGGPGLSRVDVAALIEEMAIADAGFATQEMKNRKNMYARRSLMVDLELSV